MNFVSKAAERCGFKRERHNDQNLPIDPSNITVMPFFGDIRSLFVLSSLLLKRLKEEKGYFVLASWSGCQALFPYIDEYWGLDTKMYSEANQFRNANELANSYYRNINQNFEDVIMPEYFEPYYNQGITNEFWTKYKQIKRFLPAVGLNKDFNKELQTRGGIKIFVYPSLYAQSWEMGIKQIKTKKEFWLSLIERLLKERYMPIIYRGPLTYDVSPEFTNKCLYCVEQDIGKILTVMRSVGCVLDIFSGISRIALAARCPFLVVDERSRHSVLKEYEIDDLCGIGLPKQYIFSFPTILESGVKENWEQTLFNNIIIRLNNFNLNRDELPAIGEITEIVSYDVVRKKKLNKLGVSFIRKKNE